MTADGLEYAYSKLFSFLNLKTRAQEGITVIVSPQWMFLATLNNPYHHEKMPDGRQLPVFLDGFAYSGILNLQTVKQKWPATAGRGFEQHTILSSLSTQARTEKGSQFDDFIEDY